MKKQFVTFCMCVVMAVSASAGDSSGVSFGDLPDETVLASVGKYNITMYDMKVYMVGYKTIRTWNLQLFDNILTSLMFDMLYLSACEDEGIKISEEEVALYAENFFLSRSIDINNPDEIIAYFNTHDPYYDINDFLLKSQYFLLKVKYLAAHNAIETFRSSMIYLSTAKMSKDQAAEVHRQAMKITNDILYGEITFADAVRQYSQDAETKATDGRIFSEVTAQHRIKKDFAKKEFQKIFNNGLFFPILLEGKNGYYIIMNTDCRFDDEGKAGLSITEDLQKKYAFKKKVVLRETDFYK